MKATFVITLVFDGRFYVNREFICVKINPPPSPLHPPTYFVYATVNFTLFGLQNVLYMPP